MRTRLPSDSSTVSAIGRASPAALAWHDTMDSKGRNGGLSLKCGFKLLESGAYGNEIA